MSDAVHPTIGNMLKSIFRMPPAKVQPCDHCGPEVCEFYPCENVDPRTGPDAMKAPEGAKE
ncbi:MAG: hypothetical protein PHS14_16010 [Elusimicrobia bacterium]|nr:hypothetical protein [Elusimicrobiota bacterium]